MRVNFKYLVFRDSRELLISINGKVEKGKWKYLGNNSILIDSAEGSFLFKRGFFDENILTLKIDGENEYFILINETKYGRDINSIKQLESFLEENFVFSNKPIQSIKQSVIDKKLIKKGYNWKMGSFEKYSLKLSNGKQFEIYKKENNNKFYIYENEEILLFPDEYSCQDYLIRNYF